MWRFASFVFRDFGTDYRRLAIAVRCTENRMGQVVLAEKCWFFNFYAHSTSDPPNWIQPRYSPIASFFVYYRRLPSRSCKWVFKIRVRIENQSKLSEIAGPTLNAVSNVKRHYFQETQGCCFQHFGDITPFLRIHVVPYSVQFARLGCCAWKYY